MKFELSLDKIGKLIDIGIRPLETTAIYGQRGDAIASFALIPTKRGNWIREIQDQKWEGSYIPLIIYKQGSAVILVAHEYEVAWRSFAEKLSSVLNMPVKVRPD